MTEPTAREAVHKAVAIVAAVGLSGAEALIARLERAEALVESLGRALEDDATAFQAGVRAVTLIRCMAHHEIRQYNRNEINGAECAACEVERAEAERDAARQEAHGLKERLGMLVAVHRGCTDIHARAERDRAQAWIRETNTQSIYCLDCGAFRYAPHDPGCYVAELQEKHDD